MPILSKTIKQLIDAAELGQSTTGFLVRDTGAALALDAAANGGLGRFISGANGNPAVEFAGVSVETGVDRVNAVNAATTGVVTATIDASAAELANLTGWGSGSHNQYTINVSGPISITDLQSLDGKTDGVITADLTGSGSALAAAMASMGVNNKINVTVVGPASVAELKMIDAHNGIGALTFADGIRDDVANLVNAGGTAATADAAPFLAFHPDVEVLGLPSIAQINKINTLNGSGAIGYSTIADSYTNIVADAGVGDVGAGKDIVVIAGSAQDGKPTISDLDAIALLQDASSNPYATALSVTAPVITDFASNLMMDVNATQGGHGQYIATATTLHVVDDLANNDIASISDLNAIAFAFKGATLAWQSVSGSGNDLATDAAWNGGVGRFVTADHDVIVDNGTATVTNLNYINARTTGTVTADITGTAAELAVLATGPANDYTISVSGTISASALATLDAKTDKPITATVATADASVIAAALATLGANNVITVTVNANAPVDALLTLDGLTGVATLNVTSIKDSVDHFFVGATDTYKPGVQALLAAYTVPVEITGAPSVAQLLALKTDSTLVPTYTQVADTAANLVADHASSDHFSDGVDVRVTFDGNAPSPSLQDLADVDAFAGVVTADKVIDTDQNILADINPVNGLGTYINGAVDVVFTNYADLDTLIAVRRATTGALDYSTITGSAVALAADIGVHGNHFVNSDKVVDVDTNSLGNPATAQDIANLNTIRAATTGDVYATLTGSSSVLSGLTGGSNAYFDLTVDDAHPTVDQLNTLAGKTHGDIAISGTITDSTAANLARLTGTTNIFNVTVSDAATIDQLTRIDAHSATVSYTNVADTLAHLTADKAAGTSYITGATVMITDTGANAVTVAQIKAIATGTHNPAAISALAVKDTAASLTGADKLYATGADITVTLANGHGPSVTQLATIASTLTPSHLTSTTVEDAASAIIADNVYSTVATTVVVTGTPTLANLNDVALHTPATLSYGAVSGTGNLLASNTEVTGRFNFVNGSVNVTVDNNSATVLNLNKIDAATTGVITAALSGTAAELADLRAAGFNSGAVNAYTITVTGSISADAVAALDGKTTGAITVATPVTGTAAAIKTAFAALGSNNSINVTTDANASVADLSFIDGLAGVNTLVITSIKDSVANLFTGSVVKPAVVSLINGGNIPVTVDGAPSLAQLVALNTANGTSAVTYTSVSDTAANFANSSGVATSDASTYVTSGTDVDVTTSATIAQLATVDALNGNGQLTYGGIVDALSAVVSGGVVSSFVTGSHAVDVSQTATAAIADLNAIGAATTGAITWAGVSGALSALAADADLNGGAGRFVAGSHAVTITTIASATAGDITNINKIDAVNTGVITTSLTGSAAVLGGLSNSANAYTLTVNDASPTVAGLNALVNKTSGNIGTTNTVTGSAADLATLTGTHNTFNVTAGADATVAQLAAIKLHTSGTVGYSTLKDTASALAADATLQQPVWVTAGHAVTITDGASIQNLVDIKAASGAVAPTYTTVKDSSANLAAVIDATTKLSAWIKPTTNVVVNGGGTGTTADITEIALIDAATDGTVTYGAVSGSIAALYNDAILNNSTGRYVTSHDVTVNGAPASVVAADITQLNAISAASTGAVTANLSGAAAAFVNLSSEVNHYAITVTGTISASALAALDAKTDGVISATVTTASAASIAPLLGNLGANNVITVNVSGGDSNADLASIKAHTNVTLNYSTVSDTVENLFNASSATLKTGNSALLSGHTVTVTGSTAPSLAQLATLNTTGGQGHAPVYTAIADVAANFTVSAGALTGNALTFVTAGTNVTVTGGVTVEKLNLIDAANTTGALNYTKVTDTVLNVLADIGVGPQGTYVKTGVAVDVASTDVASTALADITDLNTIRGVVGAAATMTWGNVEGGLVDLAADALLQSGSVYNGFVSGLRDVTINSVPATVGALDIAKINAIDTANGGVIHAALSGSAGVLLGLTAGLNDYDLTIDNSGTAVTVQALNLLAARTVGQIDTSNNVTGTSSQLAGLVGTHNVFDVDVANDAAVGDLALVTAHTSGVVTYTSIKDQAANLATAGTLTTNGAAFVTGSHAVEVLGGSVAQLNAVAAATTGVVTAAITGNAAQLIALADSQANHNDYSITVTGDASLVDLQAIDDASVQSLVTDGTYGRVVGTVLDLVNDHAGSGYVNGAHEVLVTGLDGSNTGIQDFIYLSDVASFTTGKVYASIKTSASDLSGLGYDSINGGNYNVYDIEVTDPSILVGDANQIAVQTAGIVTATVTGGVSDVMTLEAGNNFDVVVTGGDISLSDLAVLDQMTTGVITSSVTGSVADLAALASIAGTNDTNVVVTGVVSIQDLQDIDAHNGNGNLSYAGGIVDTAAHLYGDASLNGGEGDYLAGDNDVTIVGQVSLSQLFAIDAANGNGSLSYGVVRDDLISLDLEALRPLSGDRYVKDHEVIVDPAISPALGQDIVKLNHVLAATTQTVHATLSGSASVLVGISAESNNDLTLSVTGTVAGSDYATLNAIAARTTGVVTATVSGAAADLVNLTDAALNYNNYTVSVTGVATIDQLGIIDAATSQDLGGFLVASYAVSDTYDHLHADAGHYVNRLHAAEVQGVASLAGLKEIDDFTNGTFTWNTVKDDIGNFTGALLTTYVTGSHAVIVNDLVTSSSVSALKAVADRTHGKVTASVSGNYSQLATLTDGSDSNDYTFTVQGAASISQLVTIDGLTALNLNSTGAYSVSDSIGALLADNGVYVSGSHAADVTGSARVSELTTVDGRTTGAFTYATVADDLTSLFGDTTYAVGSHAVTVTGTVAASDWAKLNTVAGRTVGVVTATVSGAASDLAKLVDAGNTDAYTVSVSDAASIANLASIDAVTSGTITYNAIKDTHANIVADHGFYVRSSDTVTDTDAASAISGWSVAEFRGLGALNIDVLDATGNAAINVTLAQYNGFKASGVSLAAGDSFKFQNVSDFNYDGKSDVVLQNKADGSVYFWNLDGKTISSHGAFGGVPGADWVVKGTGDFDGNQYGDVVLQRSSDGAVYVWGNSSTGLSGHGFAGSQVGMVDWKIIGTGDFNGDHKTDLVFQNSKSGVVYAWDMDGNFVKDSGALSRELGTGLVAKGVGDFNGDGVSDVVLQRTTDGAVFLMEVDGSKALGGDLLASGWVGVAGVDWLVKGVGDFNNDGKSDLLFQNANNGSLYIWELDGVGSLVGHGAVTLGGSTVVPGKDWAVKDVGDYNADGKSDVMFQNASSGAVYTWELNGTAVIDHGQIGSFASTGWQVI